MNSGHGDRGDQGLDRAAWRADLAPPVPGPQLGVLEELGGGTHPGAGDAGGVQEVHDTVGGHGGERGFQDGGDLLVVCHAVGVVGEAFVVDEFGPVEDVVAQRRPFAVVLYAEVHGGTVAGVIGAVGCDGGMPGTGAAGELLSVDGVVGGLGHPLAEGVE